MDWFSGGVGSAIAACRQQQALFIVYIHDDSQESKATDEAWKTAQVQDALRSNKYVALRVAKDSLEYQQFSQLYVVFVFPSIFCIGMTGKTLVVMNGPQSSTQVGDKLTEAFQKLQNELSGGHKPPAAAGTTSTMPAATPPPTTTPTATPPPTTTPTATPTATPLINGPVTSSPPGTTSSSEGATGSSSGVAGGVEPSTPTVQADREGSKEEKLQSYQEKIKERREERAEQEFEHEKQRELQRRQQGRELGSFQQQQEERRNQSWIQERRKQKEEEKKAREEIRAKLEQDRLERQAQQRAKESAAAELRQRSRGVSATPVVSSVMSSISTAGVCRIQLRLPAGGTTVVEMDRTDTLSALRETVAQELNEKPDSVILTSMYPRHELDPELDSQNMVQLQLVPSAVILVRVKKGGISLPSGSGGGVAGSLWAALVGLLQLIVGFFTLIKNALTGVAGGDQTSRTSSSGGRQTQRRSPDGSGRPVSYDGGEGRVRKFRQEDFQDEDDDEKKKSTYNGNSTQQQ